VPELPPSDQAQSTVRVSPLSETVCCVMQCMPEGQYSQVKTPLDQELFVSSFAPLPVLTTEVTTYSPFVYAMVDMVPPPLESGSIHFPTKPGMDSPPIAGEVARGASVAMGARAATVGVDEGIRELHEQAMIIIPATVPIRTSQNFLRVSIGYLLFGIIRSNK
jgi:hypothetical protein